MTTYNSYKEAKIANPESEVWASKLARCGRDNIFGTKVSLAELTNNYFKCDPADHCVRCDDFLTLGHEFVDGDAFLSSRGEVIIITDARSNNRIIDGDDKRYILRAAALETKEPKRTKVEYVKVDLSPKDIFSAMLDGKEFYVCKDELINFDGEQFWRHTSEGKSRITYINHDHEIYRRIEAPVEWWEDAGDFINQTDDDNCSSIMEGKLHVNATLTQDQWCDFARILLEQGE